MKKYAVILLSAIALSIPLIAENMPVVELPGQVAGDTLAIFFSGDGGWRKIDQEISAVFTSRGISVVGVNSMRYFFKKKTPDETAEDINRTIDYYKAKYGRKRVLLVGYSFGADIIPFIVNRLEHKRNDISGAVMLGIAPDSTFEVSYSEWAGKAKGDYMTMPEIIKVKKTRMLFIGGSEDGATLIPSLDRKKYNVIIIKGGHHFDEDYNNLANIIIDWYAK